MLISSLIIVCLNDAAFAWGERGHDIIARVAVRHLVAQGNKKLYLPFQKREFMMGHLSNVPDIVWKADNRDERERQLNGPTHYINLELATKKPESLFELPTTYAAFASLAKVRDPQLSKEVGSAPWRIVQLQRLMGDSLKQAARAGNTDEFIRHVNTALLYGGIMGHFVGDLANPHHTTGDHDGLKTGNGGLHEYFESDVVEILQLDLAARVFSRVKQNNLIDKVLLKQYTDKQVQDVKRDPLALVFALVINSHNQLSLLVSLDDQYSLIKRSNNKTLIALRLPPTEVRQHYETFIIERLALGASVLSHLWKLAWQDAGRPDMSTFQSFYYPSAPDFIYPDYFPATSR